jgi:hypothetical protein
VVVGVAQEGRIVYHQGGVEQLEIGFVVNVLL